MPDAEKQMLCMEVWGGNAGVDRAVVLPGLDAWVYSRPHGGGPGGAGAGGDVHYVSTCAAGWTVRLLLADVAGHGQAVARVADDLRRLMRRHINDHDHARFVGSLNREFAEVGQAGTFATAVAFSFDATRNGLQVCNAGHPPPLWYVAVEGRWRTMDLGDAAALPLGIDVAGDVRRADLRLGVGDLVLCYTDALIEAADARGEMFGIDGLLDLVRGLEANPPALIGRLVAALHASDPTNLDRDDLTCLLLRPNGSRPRIPFVDRLLSSFRWAAATAGLRFKYVS